MEALFRILSKSSWLFAALTALWLYRAYALTPHTEAMSEPIGHSLLFFGFYIAAADLADPRAARGAAFVRSMAPVILTMGVVFFALAILALIKPITRNTPVPEGLFAIGLALMGLTKSAVNT